MSILLLLIIASICNESMDYMKDNVRNVDENEGMRTASVGEEMMFRKNQKTDRKLQELNNNELIDIIHDLQNQLDEESVPEENKKQKRKREYRNTIKHIVEVLVVTAAISVLLATLFFPILKVSGVSMEPTLENGQIIVLEKSGKFETGDLIGFYYQNKILLKRVIGQAGDYINIDANGNVYVNDVKLDEPYLNETALGDCDVELPYQVPDGKIFVMGDNRSKSVDSRSKLVGCVSEEQVVGRVMLRIWPLNQFGLMN